MRRFLIALLALTLAVPTFAADVKVTALTELTAASSDNLLMIVDDPGGTPASKKITISNFTGTLPAIGISNGGTIGPAATTSGHTYVLRSYDNDGAAWTSMLSCANGNSPTCTGLGAWDLSNTTLTLPSDVTLPDGIAITAGEVFIDCNGAADPYSYCVDANNSTLLAPQVSRTIINSYGRAEAQTVTLPTAAAGQTFIAIVGTQHNSAWKIQRAGIDTIHWNGTSGKTYFQETNQAVGSRVSCFTFKTGATAWTWMCGSSLGTWTTD